MKYMGSKARFAKDIYETVRKITPRQGRPWVEPFAGGMNMISSIPACDGPRYANDSNKYLIAMFKALVEGWVPPKKVSKEFYEKCKRLEEEEHIIGYVGFNCSYSGKWFGGYAGEVKTKTGKTRDYQEEAFRHIQKQVPSLMNVSFSCYSYEEMPIPENAIIYCDPPYQGTTKYKDSFDSEKFWDWVREISKKHVVYVSEYKAPDDFVCVWNSAAKSSLSANGRGGGVKKSVERLFIPKNLL